MVARILEQWLIRGIHGVQRDHVRLFLVIIPKQRQIDRVGHCLVPGIVGMQVVSAIVGGENLQRIGGILHRSLKIDYRIECAARTNPMIDRLAVGLPDVVVVARKYSSLVRGQGAAENLEPTLMRASYELEVAGYDVIGIDSLRRTRRSVAKIVDALEDNHVLDPGLNQDVSVEPG